jgi:hypothetical protein
MGVWGACGRNAPAGGNDSVDADCDARSKQHADTHANCCVDRDADVDATTYCDVRSADCDIRSADCDIRSADRDASSTDRDVRVPDCDDTAYGDAGTTHCDPDPTSRQWLYSRIWR